MMRRIYEMLSAKAHHLITKYYYDDLPPVSLLTSRVGAKVPTLETFKGGTHQYIFDDTSDEVYACTEVTHRYKEGSDLEIHVHWATNGTEEIEKSVKWQLEYTISNGNGAFGDTAIIDKEVIIPANTADRTHLITALGTIPGEDITIGTYIVWTFKRVESSGIAPALNPFAMAIGSHSLMDTLGSTTMYAK